jgi:hypothetical protein
MSKPVVGGAVAPSSSERIALSTGQKLYYLDVWNVFSFTRKFYYPPSPQTQYSVLETNDYNEGWTDDRLHYIVQIWRDSFKTDGFVLGRFIKCAVDQDACYPSRFAVFEVYRSDLLLPPQ